MIRLRSSKLDDRRIVALVKQELFPYAKQTNPAIRWNERDVRTRLSRSVTFVARERSREAVGFVTVLQRGKELFLDMLAVDREMQGRGLGSLLLHRAELYGRNRSCGAIRLFVDEANFHARRFYRRHGYAEQQYDPVLRCFAMQKTL